MQKIKVRKTLRKEDVRIISIIALLLILFISLIPFVANSSFEMKERYPQRQFYGKT